MEKGMLLTGKSIIVTGGNSGIGKAIVLAAAAEGANVVIDYRMHPEYTAEVAAAAGLSGGGCYLCRVFRVHAVVDDDVRAFGRGSEDDRLADAAVAAGDNDGLAGEQHAFLHLDRCRTGWSGESAVGVDDLAVDPSSGGADQE